MDSLVLKRRYLVLTTCFVFLHLYLLASGCFSYIGTLVELRARVMVELLVLVVVVDVDDIQRVVVGKLAVVAVELGEAKL